MYFCASVGGEAVVVLTSNMKVDGLAALVTGGAQGLGKAFTEILLKNGAKVSGGMQGHGCLG